MKLSPHVLIYPWIWEVLALVLLKGVWETLDPRPGVFSKETFGVESPDGSSSSSIAFAISDF